MAETPLTMLADFPHDLIARLARLGITTAEQLAFVTTPPHRAYLLEALEIDEARLAAAVPTIAAYRSLNEARGDDVPRSLGVLDLTPEVKRTLLNEAAPPSFAAAALPASVNHVPALQPIRPSQGDRGTCVAFAMSAVHEFHVRAQGGVDLSEQFLYHETKLIDGSPKDCGTWQVKAAQVIGTLGQCLEADWAYNPALPCNDNGVEPANARVKAGFRKATPLILNAQDVVGAKRCLSEGKLVGVSIPVWDSWYRSGSPTGRTGVITMRLGNEPRIGGHAICMVGYEDDTAQPGGGVFIIRNSWGRGWATQCRFGAGYGTLPYAYVATDAQELITLN